MMSLDGFSDWPNDLPVKFQGIVLKPDFISETDSFVMKMQIADENIIENMNKINKIPTEMSSWQRNFFINSEKDGFALCPGPNIDHILFSNGLNIIQKNQLDLYTIQWLFSVAMGIYILHSMNIDYQNLTANSVFIDSKLNARLSNFSYKLNKNDTKIPNIIYYFSPEQCKIIESQAKLSKEEKEKSDVYMFGVFLHEITTRIRHSDQYFYNKSKLESLDKLKRGAIEYMELKKENEYVPLKNLLIKCLDPDPNKRATIKDIIKELLNIKHNDIPINQNQENYFNINNVDMQKYHQYIIDIIGFKNEINYNSCKDLICNMLDNKGKIETNVKNYTCTFDDLKDGYSKGISYCLSIIDQCVEQLNEKKEDYNDFKYKYPQINEFDIMKVFFKYKDDNKKLENELINLKYSTTDENMESIKIDEARNYDGKIVFKNFYNSKFDTFFTKLESPGDIKAEYITRFLHSVERMKQWEKNFFVIPNRLFFDQSFTFCPGQNIFSFLFTKDPEKNIDKKVLDLYILEWIFSIAMGINILHEHEIYDLRLTDRLIFIDYQMHARILNVSYPLDKNFTTIPYNCYFYSPEIFFDTFKDTQIEVKSDKVDHKKRKKSDIFMFGIIAYELLTREIHYMSFKNMTLDQLKAKFKKGPIDYLNLEKRRDSIPLCDLLINCLSYESNNRWEIKEVVNYLLNIKPNQRTGKVNEDKYLDLNNIDFDSYHKFIIDSIQLDPNLFQDFEGAKINISQMMTKNKNVQILKETHNNCSFKDLEYGSKLGIAHCDKMIDLVEYVLPTVIREKYKLFCEQNQILLSENNLMNKYDVLKIFLDNSEDNDKIDAELDKLMAKAMKTGQLSCLLFNMDNDQNIFKKYIHPNYIKLPFDLESDTFSHIVHPEHPFKNRIKSYEHLNLYNFLYDKKNSHFNGQITLQQKMKWLFSVVIAIEEIHQRGYCMDSLTSKSVYIDENFNADLFVPKTFKINSYNENFIDLAEKFLESDESDNDISFYYRAPELFNDDIYDVDYTKCDVYSFAVLAKELLESNLPWELMRSISKEDQLNALKNPHWRNFLKSSFSIFNESSEINNLITILNNCLRTNPNERETAASLYSGFVNFFENTNFTDKNLDLTVTKGIRNWKKFLNLKENQKHTPNKIHSIDQSYVKAQMSDIKGRVNRCKSKVFASNLIIGSVSNSAVRQIALRYIQNTDHNIELSFLVNNTNYGIPNGRTLNMKVVYDTLTDFKNQNILSEKIGSNKKGDAIMKISSFGT